MAFQKHADRLRFLHRRKTDLHREIAAVESEICAREKVHPQLYSAQKAEITGYEVYRRLAGMAGEEEDQRILSRIADEELRHYELLKTHTGCEIAPSRTKMWFYVLVARILGAVFVLRMMESGEGLARGKYREISRLVPEMGTLEQQEDGHGNALSDMLDQKPLQYASSVVLGLSDALVELTGAIAGFTLALQRPDLIAVTSLLTGISASLSMAGSEYLSTRTDEETGKHPIKASFFTGLAYLTATILLVAPFFILPRPYSALAWTLGNALLLILLFTFYIAFARKDSFKRRFLEMAAISMGVAGISFLIGYGVRRFFGIEV